MKQFYFRNTARGDVKEVTTLCTLSPNGILMSNLTDSEKFLLSFLFQECGIDGRSCKESNADLASSFNWNARKAGGVVTSLKKKGWVSLINEQSPYREIFVTPKTIDAIKNPPMVGRQSSPRL